MTGAGLRHATTRDVQNAGPVVAMCVWAATALAVWYDLLPLSGGVALAVVFGVPPVLAVAALLRRSGSSRLPLVAGGSCAVLAALLLPVLVSREPKVAYAFPALAIAAVVSHRFPAACLGLAFAISGSYGSIVAFTPIPAVSIANVILGGLWVGLAGRMLIGRRPLAVRPTPALMLLGAFTLMTVAAVIVTEPLSSGVKALRLAPFFLSVMLLLGWGGFSDRSLRSLARVMAAVSLVLAAYATLRWAIGPAERERALLETDFARQYNEIGGIGDEKVRGALPNGQSLGIWLTCTIPFLVGAALAWRGRWRLVAAAALPLSIVALLGSGQRAALVAVVGGSALIVCLHLLARGFRGPRLGVAIAAVAGVLVSTALAYPAVVDHPEKRKRYENILSPERDAPFQERLVKWRQVLADLRDQPFGHGMGAGNPYDVGQRFADVSSVALDNSFLMIAFDQGVAVMVFFVCALTVLLIELIRHAVWTRAPDEAALAAAGAGTLLAMAIEFSSANFITAVPTIAGWMIVGLGVAQYATRRARAAD